MIRTSFRVIVAGLLATILITPAYADDQKEARLLLLEAGRVQKQAQEKLPQNAAKLVRVIGASPDGTRGSELLRQARARLREIIDKYPTTDEGMALALGNDVHGLSIAVLDQAIRNWSKIEEFFVNMNICVIEEIVDPDDPRCTDLKPMILLSLIRQDRIDEAMLVARGMENLTAKVRGLLQRAGELIDQGNNLLATEMFRNAEAVVIGGGLSSPFMTSMANEYGSVALEFAKTGDFETAIKYASVIPDQLLRRSTLRTIYFYKATASSELPVHRAPPSVVPPVVSDPFDRPNQDPHD